VFVSFFLFHEAVSFLKLALDLLQSCPSRLALVLVLSHIHISLFSAISGVRFTSCNKPDFSNRVITAVHVSVFQAPHKCFSRPPCKNVFYPPARMFFTPPMQECFPCPSARMFFTTPARMLFTPLEECFSRPPARVFFTPTAGFVARNAQMTSFNTTYS